MAPNCLSFRARSTVSRLLLYPRPPFDPRGTSPSRGGRHEQCGFSCVADTPDQSLPPEIDLSPMNNPGTPPEKLIDAVRSLKLFLPSKCELLGQGDLKITGSYPIDAGGFADVWVGQMNDGTTVAIKSHRYYASSSCLPVYLRFYREALMYSRLNDDDDDKNFVPFIAIYSTRERPFGLVFKFMDHSNLRSYLRNNKNTARLELLLETARGLKYLHELDIVHGNVDVTNVLVNGEGHVRIAGLGTAFAPSTTLAVDLYRPFHGTAPELIDPQRWEFHNTEVTTASDVYAFAILAWEVFAGRAPFSDERVIAGVNSMLSERRPARPDHPELSDRMWKTIKACWKEDPAKRKKIADVVAVLEAEVNAHKHN